MTEKKGDEAAPEAADVPPTRKHEALPDEPPARESRLSLESIELPAARVPLQVTYGVLGFAVLAALFGWGLGMVEYVTKPAAIVALVVAVLTRVVLAPRLPQDGGFSAGLRAVDHDVGLIELALLLAVFAAVVIVGSLSALSGHLVHHPIGEWWKFVVRKGTFAIAMLGAAYATHQQRLLAMDLVSRRLPPRGRQVLGIVLKLFTIALAGVLFYLGRRLYMKEGHAGPVLDLRLGVLTEKDAITVIPIGAALIMFHSLVHALIEGDYLVRGKQAAEHARTGH